jgi:hypothetical protein
MLYQQPSHGSSGGSAAGDQLSARGAIRLRGISCLRAGLLIHVGEKQCWSCHGERDAESETGCAVCRSHGAFVLWTPLLLMCTSLLLGVALRATAGARSRQLAPPFLAGGRPAQTLRMSLRGGSSEGPVKRLGPYMDDEVPQHCDTAQWIESMLRLARACIY